VYIKRTARVPIMEYRYLWGIRVFLEERMRRTDGRLLCMESVVSSKRIHTNMSKIKTPINILKLLIVYSDLYFKTLNSLL
jgi:hypothetical protein